MLAGNTSAFLVTNLPRHSDPSPSAYYRSKLFVASFATNPMVAAAGPLLSLIERLSQGLIFPNLNEIRKNIEHELHAFHSQLKGKSYTSDFEGIAHYFLCATIDELMLQNTEKRTNVNEKFQALTPISQDGVSRETRFFELLHFLKEKPEQYLDLIELAYYCLASGFQGMYREHAEGPRILDDLNTELSKLILNYRVNPTYTLFFKDKTPALPKRSGKMLFITGFVSLTLFILIGTLSYFSIQDKAREIQMAHAVIADLGDE